MRVDYGLHRYYAVEVCQISLPLEMKFFSTPLLKRCLDVVWIKFLLGIVREFMMVCYGILRRGNAQRASVFLGAIFFLVIKGCMSCLDERLVWLT